MVVSVDRSGGRIQKHRLAVVVNTYAESACETIEREAPRCQHSRHLAIVPGIAHAQFLGDNGRLVGARD
jgi:hypothetical protein